MTTTAPPSAAAKLVAQIEKIAVARIQSAKISLPALPTVAAKAMSILRDANFNQRKLAEVIATDPVLLGTILHEGSAASFASGVKSIDQAISRLGANRLKSLVVTYTAYPVFQSPDKQIAAAARKVWEHSLAVSVLARDLGAFTGECDPEECYVVGLLHDIGKPIVASYLLEAERKLGRDSPGWLPRADWQTVIEGAHRPIGAEIARAWKLPDEVSSAITDCADYDPGERQRPANVVRLANAVAKRHGFATTETIDEADLDAMIMVGKSMLGIDDTKINGLLTGLKDRLAL